VRTHRPGGQHIFVRIIYAMTGGPFTYEDEDGGASCAQVRAQSGRARPNSKEALGWGPGACSLAAFISYQSVISYRLVATAVKFLLAETFDNSKELPLG
jgi:hypothetical protein